MAIQSTSPCPLLTKEGGFVQRGKWILLFLALFQFHLFSAGGACVPYRDTGEMVVNAATLGVAHPPGYPLYVLAGKIAQALPWGNPAFKLNVVSAASSALAGVFFVLLLAGLAGFGVAALAAGFWATSSIFWELSSVSEMYTLAILWLSVILWLVRRASLAADPRAAQKTWIFIFFFIGLGFGVRTDLLLLAPLLVFLCWRQNGPVKTFLFGLWTLAGLSIYLYLPLRSSQFPVLDWGHPDSFAGVMKSLMRASHGATLDMLSKSYQAGENFKSQMALFLKDSAGALSVAGAPLAVLGLAGLWRRHDGRFGLLAWLWLVFGVLFIFLGNLPPNPHAMAVLEAHFLVPQLAMALAVGAGLGLVEKKIAGPLRATVFYGTLLALLSANAWAHAPRGVKRWNFYGEDYVTNLSRSALPGSVGVIREDVPLFGFWQKQITRGLRPDIVILAQGLAASPWYHKMVAQQDSGVFVGGLKDDSDWARFVQSNPSRPLWISVDASGPRRPGGPARGLAHYLSPTDPASAKPLAPEEFFVMRGPYIADEAPDFFSGDLVSETAQSFARSSRLEWARRLDPAVPTTLFHLAYRAYEAGDRDRAAALYEQASRLIDEMLKKAAYYKTFPDTVAGIKKEGSDIWVHRGVLAEKSGKIDGARADYARALDLNPRNAQAHYNLAVTFWNRDWKKAAAHFANAAALDPQNAVYQREYVRAKGNLEKTGSK
jgi:hypothetical protein